MMRSIVSLCIGYFWVSYTIVTVTYKSVLRQRKTETDVEREEEWIAQGESIGKDRRKRKRGEKEGWDEKEELSKVFHLVTDQNVCRHHVTLYNHLSVVVFFCYINFLFSTSFVSNPA